MIFIKLNKIEIFIYMNDNKEFEIRQYRLVFPHTLNCNETLFGGLAMQWMDEVAYICAVKFIKKKMVTVCVDKINFKSPIISGSLIELVANVEKYGNARLNIKVEIFAEEAYSDVKKLAIDTVFTFAAVDEDSNPTRLFDN